MFNQTDDTQSSRSGDTPITTSQSNTNSSQIADNTSEIGKCLLLTGHLHIPVHGVVTTLSPKKDISLTPNSQCLLFMGKTS